MSKKIMVIEDEQDIAELIRFNLGLDGYDVSTFSTGEEGYDAITANQPDLLILDIMLPGMSGLEICRRVRENEKISNTPIVMVTAKGEEGDIVRGLELGADDYVSRNISVGLRK